MAIPGPALDLVSVSLRRGSRRALDGVTATFPPRTVTAVVGPSGAGKTSLLRCLNRLEEPEEGRVLLDGQPVAGLLPTELRRRVGLVGQVPVPFLGDVRANLAWGLADPTDGDLAEALDAVGLPNDLLDRDARELSVGQAQRMCLARALTRHPSALLLDEPTSALDPSSTETIERLVGRLAHDGMTVVIVTHDEAQTHRISNRSVRLLDGRVVE
ncbi:MAG: phosphate ABC transporter ATP-binding protein [Acidimicrobiia bacterium]